MTLAAPPPPPIELHRVRFLESVPSPITALSFAPLPLPLASSYGTKGKSRDNGQQSPELGVLLVARENGDVEIWSWDIERGGTGNWTLTKVLPPTLTHPTVNLMSLVIRDPIDFPTKGYAVPKLQDLRLFTTGNDSTEVIERCLSTGRILNTTYIPSAPIWSMSVSPTHQYLALSSTAQTLTFLSLEPGSAPAPPPPHLLRCESLPSRCRTVSIAWGPPRIIKNEDDEPVWVDSYLITGNSDTSLRKWELPSPQDGTKPGCRVTLKGRAVVERIQKAGRGGHGKKSTAGNQKGTIVWGVGVLPDHTIVSSDSLGSVTFWDGASMAQKQSFQAHRADGMCLTIGPAGRTVFTSGPDQRVCQFTNVPTPTGEQRWVQTSTKRVHSHDVRALSVFPPYSPFSPVVNKGVAPVLASGGWDMALTLTPCAAPELDSDSLRNPLGKMVVEPHGRSKVVFDEAILRRMSFFGGGRGTGRVQIAREAKLLVCRNERSLSVWKVGGNGQDQPWEKCLDMDLRLRTNLTTTAISNDGQWLAVSDLYETKLFHLRVTPGGSLAAKRVKSFIDTLHSSAELAHLGLPGVGTGSSALLFTHDSQRLVMSLYHSSSVVICELSRGDEADVRVMKAFGAIESESGRSVIRPKKRSKSEKVVANGLSNGDEAMTNGLPNAHSHSDTDSDDQEMEEGISNAVRANDKATPGAWVACAAASEDGQWLAVSDLAGQSAIFNLDTLRLHSILPTFSAPPTAISFPPSQPSLLSVALSTGTVHFYHIEHRLLIPPTPQLATLNTILSTRYTPLQDMAYEPERNNTKGAKVLLWGWDWLCPAHLDLDLIVAQSATGKRDTSANGQGISKVLRKKRAREARDALEAISISGSSDYQSHSQTPSISLGGAPKRGGYAGYPGKPTSSADDPEFFKFVSDKFRSIVGAEWFGVGEMCVIERPFGDFVGELPQAFWSGSFGRS